MDTQNMLGSIIDYKTNVSRDAVHVAVLPVIADQVLSPGSRVRFVDGSIEKVVGCDVITTSNKVLGIVDPFLEVGNVLYGQRFFCFLTPNTVTGMRHHWLHPIVDANEVSYHLAWLQDFAKRHYYNVDQLIAGASEGGEVYAHDEISGTYNWDVPESEFWEHLQAYTGKYFDEDHRGSVCYRCGC